MFRDCRFAIELTRIDNNLRFEKQCLERVFGLQKRTQQPFNHQANRKNFYCLVAGFISHYLVNETF